jgi:predicted deacetylase
LEHNNQKIGLITIHDITPFQDYLSKTIEVIKQLENVGVHYNLAIVPNYRKESIITHDNFMVNISNYLKKDKPNIALHGLYHEYRNCIEDFHTLTTAETRDEIAKGLSIFKQVSLPRPKVFIPPAWYVSLSTLEALQQSEFEIVESMDNLYLIQNEVVIITQQVLNWDISGNAQENKRMIKENQLVYDKIMRGFKPNILRLALHPPHDPPEALDQQLEIIRGLGEEAEYTFKTYHELIQIYD